MASSGGKDYEIDQSLMIEADGGALSLKRTPSSGGNRRTFTWSGWVKKTKNGAYQSIFASITNSSNTIDSLMFYNDDKFTFQGFNGANFNLMTTRVFRDISAWYHIVLAVDSTQGTASNRIKIYINGVQETSFGTETYCSQNFDFGVNHTVPQSIANNDYNRVSGYLADINFIDGTQLTPSSFGETDSETGQWIPKKYGGGSYGTNGFYLPFAKNDRYSVYFDGSTSAGLQTADSSDFTFGTNNFTAEAWFYSYEDQGNTRYIIGQGPASGATAESSISFLIDANNKLRSYIAYSGGYLDLISSTAMVENTWYHGALVRNSNTFTLYLNGTSVASTTSSITVVDSDDKMAVGIAGEYTTAHNFKGWISNARIVNGTAVYTSNFTPSTSPLTAITNTKLLCCQDATITTDNSGTNKTLTILNAANTYTQQMSPFTYDWYQDQSGQDNHFTADNLTVNDIMLDSPTNNYPTINSLEPYNSTLATLAQGNLHAYATTYDSHYYGNHTATFLVPESGKWYIETRMAVYNGTGNDSWIGVIDQRTATIPKRYGYGATAGYYLTDSNFTGMVASLIATVDTIRLFRGGSAQATVSSATETSYIIALALDVDNNKVYGGYDSGSGITWLASGNPAAGSNGQAHTFTNDTVIQLEVGPKSDGTSNSMQTLNFGQNGTFSGYETAGGNTDGNGEGNFFYAPPSGFLALCSKNLPDPAIKDPSAHFNTLLYTGNDADDRTLTGVGFQPDLVWIKTRDTTNYHQLMDSVRGVSKRLNTNNNNTEFSDSDPNNSLVAFTSDGFTVDDSSAYADLNASAHNYVAWNWKAGGSGSSNTAGTINTISTSVNTTAGISISAYTGTGSTGTIGHGLGVAPSVIIVKNTDTNDNWRVQTISDATDYMALNWTGASTDDSSSWNDTAATSTVFTIGTDTNTNRSGDKFVAYCFADVSGFSKAGWFRGNASANGTFVNLGFSPAYIMLKMRSVAVSGGGDWIVRDVKRDVDNPSNSAIYTNLNNAESTTSLLVDIVSNGFKIRSNHDDHNKADETVWWMAFAEFPFKYANAR
jgi:hypothetical protein